MRDLLNSAEDENAFEIKPAASSPMRDKLPGAKTTRVGEA
jgi:hypothetical protein